jgi:hypothetical protein
LEPAGFVHQVPHVHGQELRTIKETTAASTLRMQQDTALPGCRSQIGNQPNATADAHATRNCAALTIVTECAAEKLFAS